MGQKQKKNLKIAVLNIRSLLVKFADFKNTVVNSCNFDIIALTETWLNQNVDSDLLSLDGYQLFRNDRIDSRGGGVSIYIANRIRCSKIDLISSIEQLWITFKIGAVSFCFGVVYRPPKSNVYDFINQFQDSLSYLCPRYDQMVCTGDFNIDFLDRNAKAVKLFDDSMDAFGLHQVITAPTRFGVSSETLLDLFFCSEGIECSFDITDVSNLSDHCLVSVDLQYLIDLKQTTVIRSYRDFKNFDLEAFKLALGETDFMQIVHCHDIDMKLDIFNHLVLDLFDKYAPYRTASFTKKPAPWLTADIKFLMKLRNDKFTAYRKTKSRESWEEYKELRNITNFTVNHAKKFILNKK
nr:unnamed protein product [Callosobruchus chinensis]